MTGTRRSFALAVLATIGLVACGDRAPTAATPATPTRVVSQTVLSDEVLWELGEAVRPRVVGLSALVDDPVYSGVAGRWPTDVARIRTAAEDLVALKPDLAIIAGFTAAETRHILDTAAIPTVVLEGFSGFSDYRSHVRTIASAVDAREQGARLVATFDDRLATIRREAGPTTAVSYDAGLVPGRGTTFDDEARAAGLTNLAARHGIEGHRRVSVETLIAWDPDVLVLACPAPCQGPPPLPKLPGIDAMRAVREHRVIGVPPDALYSTGAGMLAVVERLSAGAVMEDG